MMGHVKDDFYVEDESLDEVQHAWDSGEPVLVIPSRLRRQLRERVGKLRRLLDADLRRSTDRAKARRPQSGQP
jgi:hypothetical protein